MIPQPSEWRLGPPGAEGAPYVEYASGDRRFHRDSEYRLWARDCSAWTVARLAAAGLARAGGGVVVSGQVAGRLVGFARAGGRHA